MVLSGAHGPQGYERRARHRAELAVPVSFARMARTGEEGPSVEAKTLNISSGGAYLTTAEPGPFAVGDILSASIEIPRESRRIFPFSRILGSCRVVRVEPIPTDVGRHWGLALEFMGGQVTLLGAIISP